MSKEWEDRLQDAGWRLQGSPIYAYGLQPFFVDD